MPTPLRFLNDTLTIRPAHPGDAAAIARVYVDSWRETYRGLIPQAYLDSMSYAAHERRWRASFAAGGWAFVAEVEKRVVGLAAGGSCRTRGAFGGELFVLYVLGFFHNRGVGRGLFDATQIELARRGHGDMLVRVLATNPSRGFYEHLGGDRVGDSFCEIGGVRLKELAYGWRD
jgi:GNAT superfamily N-acetyltransferase